MIISNKPKIMLKMKFINLISCRRCNVFTNIEVTDEIDPIMFRSITTTSKANHKIRPKKRKGTTKPYSYIRLKISCCKN